MLGYESNGKSASGVALFFSKDAGASDIRAEHRDPEGRFLAVRATIRGQDYMFIVLHAATLPDNQSGSADRDQESLYNRAHDNIPKIADHEYVWLMDTNNTPTPHLDHKRNSASPHGHHTAFTLGELMPPTHQSKDFQCAMHRVCF